LVFVIADIKPVYFPTGNGFRAKDNFQFAHSISYYFIERNLPVRSSLVVYVLLLACVCVRFYEAPQWDMDMIGYMGNALMTNRTPFEKAHQLVYAEILRLPENVRIPLLGLNTSGGNASQNASRKARFEHAESFGEFLPFFAIRPLYNQLLFLASRAFGLLRSAVLLSIVPYFLLGLLVFRWCSRYVQPGCAVLFSLLLMLMPPVAQMGRTPISDALSTLVATFSLYLLLETKRETIGLVLLLASIFFRTDNVALAAAVLAFLWFVRRLSSFQTFVLGAIAAGSVLFINKMAGDYGVAMLYYRNFIGTPITPAEMVLHLSRADYFRALRGSLGVIAQSWLMPFLLLAVIGLYRRTIRFAFSGIALLYIGIHFLILPNWVERWFVVAYIPLALSAVCGNDALYDAVFGGLKESITNQTGRSKGGDS